MPPASQHCSWITMPALPAEPGSLEGSQGAMQPEEPCSLKPSKAHRCMRGEQMDAPCPARTTREHPVL